MLKKKKKTPEGPVRLGTGQRNRVDERPCEKKRSGPSTQAAHVIAESKRIEGDGKQGESQPQNRTEELERANRIKDEFLATLSHELRTRINAILGWTTLLHGHPCDSTLARALQIIECNARAQSELIENILDLSRITAGKVRIEMGRVEFIQLIHSAIDTLRPAAEIKEIEWVLDLDPSANTIWGDFSRLQQVILNLLSNAVKFSHPGGSVALRLKRVQSQVEFQVKDSGRGIEPSFLSYLFDRFRQEDCSSARLNTGLGLGLSIVRNLVELHGGSVRAESPGTGKGATFILILPAPRALQRQMRGAKPLPSNPRNMVPIKSFPKLDCVKILVIDDDPDTRELMQATFEGCNAFVKVAGSAREGLEAFECSRPDIVISDIGMPGEDGYAFIRKLRAMEQDGRVPAIAVTGYAFPEEGTDAISAGYQMRVTKPIEPYNLVRIVAKLYRKHVKRRPGVPEVESA